MVLVSTSFSGLSADWSAGWEVEVGAEAAAGEGGGCAAAATIEGFAVVCWVSSAVVCSSPFFFGRAGRRYF
jgi:hypothetical protein